ncbi:MAG: arylesterase [Bdellovibrionaceae bacterium]|nr:arylesterase [Pseudobdellovibrionaceae bacterium]
MLTPTFFVALIFPFSLGFAQTPTSNAAPEIKTKKLIVLGDSLTEGYGVSRETAFPAVLEKRIHEGGKKDWSVVNAGVSGSTTASAVSRMKWVFRTKPDMVILCLGANDGLRGLKVAESKKNLDEAIRYAKSQNVPVILGGLYMPPNYGKEYTSEFHKMYEDLAKEHKVAFIPFLLEGVGGKSQYNLADGIHPNEKGHEIIAKTVYDAIKGKL